MAGRLEGKVAFITGAARGQGRSHAVRLAQEGADIIAIDICGPVSGGSVEAATEADLAETVAQVEALGRRILARKADVRSQDELDAVVADGVEQFGRLDIVAANAGISSANGGMVAHVIEEDDLVTIQQVNLIGVWRTAKAAIPRMIAAGNGGSIAITSSVAGLRGYQHAAPYVAAKHAVVGLMRTLALELAPHWIRVKSIHPTQVNTPMIMNDGLYRLFRPDLENPTVDDFAPASQAMNALPIPWVESVDISNALLFLASEEARYITGVALPVDAGCAIK